MPAVCSASRSGRCRSHWLGFAGSGVLWIAALVAGMSLALRFSWLALSEAIGASIDGLRERRQRRRSRPRTAASAKPRWSSASMW
jgi:hypothetical protein